MTRINANGSKWNGQEPDTIEVLLQRLRENTLDPRFEQMGNFILSAKGGRLHFWGNFFDISHVFSIVTDDRELIDQLTAAIRLNQQSQAYREARRERDAA